MTQCSHCAGKGHVMNFPAIRHEVGIMGRKAVKVVCPECDGEGVTTPIETEAARMELSEFGQAAVDLGHAYHELAIVLLRAFEQATQGKGKERHANGRAFRDQPMQTISGLIGSPDGLAFQAIKKIQESQRMDHEAAVAELLGAIIYTAGNIIFRGKRKA